ncbi:MAG: hypothetical protein ACYCQL_05160 [Acidithiobacillus sp.]
MLQVSQVLHPAGNRLDPGFGTELNKRFPRCQESSAGMTMTALFSASSLRL